MIWLVLSVLPFAALVIVGLIKDPEGVLVVTVGTTAVVGLVLLGCYGAWEMNWLNHCGNFWESYSCTGKVITNR